MSLDVDIMQLWRTERELIRQERPEYRHYGLLHYEMQVEQLERSDAPQVTKDYYAARYVKLHREFQPKLGLWG